MAGAQAISRKNGHSCSAEKQCDLKLNVRSCVTELVSQVSSVQWTRRTLEKQHTFDVLPPDFRKEQSLKIGEAERQGVRRVSSGRKTRWVRLQAQQGVCLGFWGAWVAQSVEHLTLHFSSGHDLRVMGSSPTLNFVLGTDSA